MFNSDCHYTKEAVHDDSEQIVRVADTDFADRTARPSRW